jgi:FtsH-binding integral membrane protein
MPQVYKTAHNSQLRIAIVCFFLSACGFFAALFLSKYITKFDVRGAVTFLGIFLFVAGGFIGLIFVRRARIFADMLMDIDVITSFRYPKHVLQKLAEETKAKRLQDNKIKFIFISVIVFFVAFFTTALLIFDENYEAILFLLLVFLVLETVIYAASKLSPAAAFQRVIRSEGKIIIASRGVLFCGEVHIWKSFMAKLISVYLENKKKSPALIFKYSYYVSFVPPIKNTFEVRIPFFDMDSKAITEKVNKHFNSYLKEV